MNIEEIFKFILVSSAMGSILALLILFIKIVFRKKLNAHWSYYIWFILLIRLIMPFAPESSMSVFNLFDSTNGPPKIIREEFTYIAKENDIVIEQDIYAPVDDSIVDNTIIKDNPTKNTSTPALKQNNFSLLKTLSIVWLSGVLIIALYTMIVNLRLWNILRKKPPTSNKKIIFLWEDSKRKMNIHTDIPIISDSSIKTPTLFSFLKLRLIFPEKMIHELSEDELRYILLHELAHVKRLDILTNWIMVITQILHWFNPMIWYSFYKMRQDCEISCDATVLSRLNKEEHKSYGMTIINLLEMFSSQYFIPGTSSIIKSKSGIKRRIKMITQFKKHPLIWSIIGVGIAAILVFIGLTNPIGSTNKPSEENQLVEMVKTLEENEYAFKKLDITYEEFQNNIKTIMPEDYKGTYIDYDFVYAGAKDGMLHHYQVSDLKNLSDEDFEYHQNYLKMGPPINFEIGYENSDVVVSISKPYEPSDKDKRVVFVQKVIRQDKNTLKKVLDTSDTSSLFKETYINRKYTFKKENSQWKFLKRDIDMKHITFEEFENTDNIEEFLNDMKLNTINGEKVEYDTVITLSK